MSNRPPHPRTVSNSSLTPPGSVYNTPPNYPSPGLAPPTTFERSPSVTAVVDYFETKSRPTGSESARTSPEKTRAQGRSSPARSVPGPSRPPARTRSNDAGPSGLPRPTPRSLAGYRSNASTSDVPSIPVSHHRPSTSTSDLTRSRRLSGQRLGSTPHGPRRPSTASNTSPRSGRLSMDSRSSFSSIQSDRRTDFTSSFRNLTVSPEGDGEPDRLRGSSSPKSRLRQPVSSLGDSGIPRHSPTKTPPGSYPSSSAYPFPRSRSTPNGVGDTSPTKASTSGLPLPSKRKPPVSVSVSRPTPEKISPSKGRRAQSFPQAEATTPTTPTARSFVGDPEKPGSRRTSFHLSSTSGSSRPSSGLTSEFADEMGRLPEALEAYNQQHTSPRKPPSAFSDTHSLIKKPSIEIPPRRSSIDYTSPMTRTSTGPPISPRKSSMPDQSPLLSDTYTALLKDEENNEESVTPHGRSSPPAKLPSTNELDAAPIPPPITSDRRGLGLSINPSLPHRQSSGPIPPVPAKSPLRSMGNQSNPAPTSADSPAALYLDSPQIPEPPPSSATASTTSLDKSFISESSTSAGKRTNGRRRGSRFFEMDEVNEFKNNSDSLEAPSSEIRFTSVTFPSVYSQDSAPNTAWLSPDSEPPTAWSMDSGPPSSSLWGQHDLSPLRTSIERSHADRPPQREATRGKPRGKGLDDLWGRKRGSKQDHDVGTEALSELQGLPPLPRLTMPDETGVEMTDSPITATTMSAGTIRSMSSNTASTGHAGLVAIPRPAQDIQISTKPVRSPSAPVLGGPIRTTHAASSASSAAISRDQLYIAPDQLLPSAISRSPTAPTLSPGLSTPSGSKRTHLIREIAMTERAYAKDLALVRDAYLSRELGTTTPQLGELPVPPRSPVRSRQVSEQNPAGSDETPSVSQPRTPSGAGSLNVPGYFAPYHSPGAASTSVHSLSPSAFTSNRSSIVSVSANSTAAGKPLSTADVRTIFCNIDLLASGAEEMATALEMAMGNEVGGPGSEAREGEGGTDKIGEAFIKVLPHLRPLYLLYCARQSAASDRLIELQADHGHHAFLKDCWEQIRLHTHAWNLDSMLIKPVQRITKYPLLFDDLLACTTPVHPDYFNIRSAAEMARSLAVEIDEEKRRKDIVAYAIAPRKSLSTTSPSKENNKGKGLKLFRREKSIASSVPMSTTTSSSVELETVPDVSEASLALMTTLAARLEEYELSVRKIGKEVVFWTASVKEVLFAEDQMITSWIRVIHLEGSGPPADRMDAFRAGLKDALTGPWATLNAEIKSQVMPSLAKLLQAAVNPRKVITRRDLKLVEYGRYVALRDARKPMDRALVQSARDFVALHTQLVHELPTFLDGYARILDIAIIAFSECQARYHARVKDILEAFKSRWFVLPRKRSPQVELSSPNGEVAGSGREIVKLWHQAWAPYGQALDHFHFVQPSRTHPPRLQSYNAPSETSTLGRVPSLSHSSSFQASSSTSRPESPSKNSTRARAASLRQKVQAQPPTQDKSISPSESRFSLLRNSNRPSKTDLAARANRPSSVTLSGSERSRYSFGLPKITSEATGRMFEGLGLSPTKPSTASSRGGLRATSDPHAYTDVTAPRRRSAAGLGLGIMGEHGERVASERISNGHSSVAESKESSTSNGTRSTREKIDAAEGWRNEPVLYQCACVADFDIRVWGHKKYRGLRFLSMRSGDLFDIFHEVGRIDELPSFPYPQVGVENDGVLVGRSEDGAIGLLICSFLEPLRES